MGPVLAHDAVCKSPLCAPVPAATCRLVDIVLDCLRLGACPDAAMSRQAAHINRLCGLGSQCCRRQ